MDRVKKEMFKFSMSQNFHLIQNYVFLSLHFL